MKLEDHDLLVDFAKNEKNQIVRALAVDRLTDLALLEELYVNNFRELVGYRAGLRLDELGRTPEEKERMDELRRNLPRP